MPSPNKHDFLGLLSGFLTTVAALVAAATALAFVAIAGSALEVPAGFPPLIILAIAFGGSLIAGLVGLAIALLLYALGASLRLLLLIERDLRSHRSGSHPSQDP